MENNTIKLDPTSISNILTLRYDPTQTPLLPKISSKDLRNSNDAPSIDVIEKTICANIKNQIPNSTKNICIALSGGVDSTLVMALLRKTLPDIQIDALSVKFANSVDESQSAAKIAKHFDAKHHIIEVDNYLKDLPKSIAIIKMPFWDLHWFYVVKKARTLSEHLFSGDGGDEVFGGYVFRYKKFLNLTKENSDIFEKVMAYIQCHERDNVPDQEKIFGPKSKFSWDVIYRVLSPYFDNDLSRLDQVLLADYNGKLLYNFSLINTRLHNHFGIKSTTPLLAKDLTHCVIPLSNKFKYDEKNNVGKLLLRELLKKLNIDSLITEEKLGFNVNTINLWKSRGHHLSKQYLSNSRVVEDGWINGNWIDQYVDKPDLDVRYVNKFLGLLAFEIWYRIFMTKEMDTNTVLN